jgi:hypothetical protein
VGGPAELTVAETEAYVRAFAVAQRERQMQADTRR